MKGNYQRIKGSDSHVLQHKHHLNLADSALLGRIKGAWRAGLFNGGPSAVLEQLFNTSRKDLLAQRVQDALPTHLDYLAVLARDGTFEDAQRGVRVCPAADVRHDYLRPALALPLRSALGRQQGVTVAPGHAHAGLGDELLLPAVVSLLPRVVVEPALARKLSHWSLLSPSVPVVSWRGNCLLASWCEWQLWSSTSARARSSLLTKRRRHCAGR